jgi:type IV secretory pathway VirJ component
MPGSARTSAGWFTLCFAVAGLALIPGVGGLAAPGVAAPPIDLPLQARAPQHGSDTLIIMLSGDGGWDASEDGLAASLNAAGPGVVGLDSKTYFDDRKTAEQVAGDLQRIADFYRKTWHTHRLVLAGYSFGGNILPFAWPALSAPTRRSTRLMVLISPTQEANFQISLLEMFDMPSSDDTPLGPALRQVPMHRFLCIYGEDEADDSGCQLPEIPRSSRMERPGAHRFEGYADVIATTILRRLK